MDIKEREELILKVEKAKKQIELLRKQQSELEREKAELEELKSKQEEWLHGKKEIGEALLKAGTILTSEEGEADRMNELVKHTKQNLSRILDELRAVKEESWTPSTLKDDLTKALLIVQKGRKELSKARARIPALEERQLQEGATPQPQTATLFKGPATLSSRELIRIGFLVALPLVLMALVILLIFFGI